MDIKPEDKKYLSGKPTRMEVANYVNALLEQHWVPRLLNQMQLSVMIIQGILLKKNICTPEEIKEITEEFINEHKQRQEQSLDKEITTLIESPLTSKEELEILTSVKSVLDGNKISLDELNKLMSKIAKSSLNIIEPLIKELGKIRATMLN